MDIRDIDSFYIPTTFAPATTHVAGRPVEWPLRLQHALLDATALDALNRLVVGEVRSWEDLQAAEMALRAVVLHERADCLVPAVLVTNRIGLDGGMTSVNYAPPDEPEGVLDVVKAAGMHNRPVFAEWLSARNGSLLDKASFWTGRESVLFGGDPQAKAEAFEGYLSSDRMAAPFLATASMIGAPSYFGRKNTRDWETGRLGNPSLLSAGKFFSTIDDAMAKQLETYQFVGLDVRMGLFVEIVLGRATKRNDIPRAILELRSQFEKPRDKLWMLFEEIQWERDSRNLQANATRLQQAAQAVIPAAFPPRTNVLRVLLNSVANATSIIGALGPILDALMVYNKPQTQVNKVDAARLLSRELKAAAPDLLSPLKNHLSGAELRALGL